MAEKHVVMGRRRFLYKSAAFVTGSLIGFHGLPRAFARNHSQKKPRISLIIDDIGFSRTRARMFLDLGVPLTFSILPRLVKSTPLAEEIHAKGHDIMLHQPMEPRNPEIDPGPGALYVGDGHEKITKVMENNISDIPFVIGVNNHMGSKFTASQEDVMEAMKVIKSKDLFFIDSLTTPRSKAYKTAKSLHITSANRNIFIDINREQSAIFSQLNKLTSYAMRHGHAIGIGHPYPETADVLSCFLPKLMDSNISLVHISHLMPTNHSA